MTQRIPFLVSVAGLTGCLLAMGLTGPIGAWPRLFAVLYGGGFAFLLGAAAFFPESLDRRRSLVLIFTLAVAVRIPFLLHWPVNTDAMRYLWEGFLQTRGHNPYLSAPQAFAASGLAGGAMAEVFARINHKDLAACYPPLAELIFWGVARISPTPGALKAVLAAFDLGAAAFLAALLIRRGLPVSRLFLYALNPLVVVFVCGEGHLDAIQAFFLAAALYCFASGRDGRGFFALGAAVMTKYLAVVLFPFFLTRENCRRSLWFALPFAAFLPFLDAGTELFSSIGVFGALMSFNASLTFLARLVFGRLWLFATLILLAASLGMIWLFCAGRLRGAFLATGTTLLFLPSLFPWYLIVVSVFLPLFPSMPWIFLHAAMVAHVPIMAAEYATGVFRPVSGLWIWEYVPFFLLLLYGLYRPGALLPARRFARVDSLSVIIPTLNESAMISGCLDSVAAAGAPLEGVVVCDCGSTDDTCEQAAALGARVVLCERGRGGQIRAGVEAAAGDAVLVLHADCRLLPGTPQRILAALNACPESLGGAAGMVFDRPGPKTWLIQSLNAMRLRLTGISFGDQGQFFRRKALLECGGFPRTMLMEDVEAGFLQKQAGPVLALSKGVRASGRSWRGRGFTGNFFRIVLLFFRYLFVRRLGIADPTGRAYYRSYYGKDVSPGPTRPW